VLEAVTQAGTLAERVEPESLERGEDVVVTGGWVAGRLESLVREARKIILGEEISHPPSIATPHDKGVSCRLEMRLRDDSVFDEARPILGTVSV
jgi:hypothetical protein